MHNKNRRNNILFPAIENIINEVANAPLNDIASKKVNFYSRPKANILASEDQYSIQLALPGLTKEDILIKVNKGELLVSSKEIKKQEGNFKLREFGYDNFERKFILPDNIDLEKINASFENGILDISLQKAEEAKPKTIEIK